MSTFKEVWDNLSTIDVSPWIESRKIGGRSMSWISWSNCMAILQSEYPDFTYEFSPVVIYPDGSAEVECTVSIGDLSRTIHLPVMDNRYDSVVAGPESCPPSRDINDSRWRAFVKCCAVYGLGFQLYRNGEGNFEAIGQGSVTASTPTINTPQIKSEARKDLLTTIEVCEKVGTIDAEHLRLAKDIANDPDESLSRMQRAINHLNSELAK